jgi:hypothetical protein
LCVDWFEQPWRRIAVLEDSLRFFPFQANDFRPFLLFIIAEFSKFLSFELVTFFGAIFLKPVCGIELRIEVGFQ